MQYNKATRSEEILAYLKQCDLGKNMTDAQVYQLLDDSRIEFKTYRKNEFIFLEGDKPQKLYIFLNGKITIAKDTLAGKRILIVNIERAGEIFGEVYLFIEKQKYEMYAQAARDSNILEISNEVFLMTGREKTEAERILKHNLTCVIANKAYQLNQKLKVLGSDTIREKIVRYLFERQDIDGKIKGNLNRENMADYLNAARPSLSRELGKMSQEGVIELKGKEIIVLDQEEFESYL